MMWAIRKFVDLPMR